MRTYRLPDRDAGGDHYLDVVVTNDPYSEGVMTLFAWGHPVASLQFQDPGQVWDLPYPVSTRGREVVGNLLLEFGAVDEAALQLLLRELGQEREMQAFDRLDEAQDEHALVDRLETVRGWVVRQEQIREDQGEEYARSLAEKIAQEIEDVGGYRPVVDEGDEHGYAHWRVLHDDRTCWVVSVQTAYLEKWEVEG